jgi:hypothetical protein
MTPVCATLSSTAKTDPNAVPKIRMTALQPCGASKAMTTTQQRQITIAVLMTRLKRPVRSAALIGTTGCFAAFNTPLKAPIAADT